MSILFGGVGALVSSTGLIAQAEVSAPRPNSIERMTAAEQQMLSAIKAIEDRAGELSKLTQAINAATSQSSKDQDKSKELYSTLWTEFPGIFLLLLVDDSNPLFKGTTLPTDPVIIKSAIHKSYLQLRDHGPSSCFPSSTEAIVESPACKKRLQELCRAFASDGQGQLSVVTISGEMTTLVHPVANPESLHQFDTPDMSTEAATKELSKNTSDLVEAWSADAFYFCTTASERGKRFEARMITGAKPSPSAAAPAVITSSDDLIKECVDIDVGGAQAKVDELKASFPDDSIVDLWHTWIGKRVGECNRAAQMWCGNTYFVKGEIILAYVTTACKVREVTIEDVDEDIKKFAALGFTRADQLKHGQLRDLLENCKSAWGRGVEWGYVAPSTKDCHPESESKGN